MATQAGVAETRPRRIGVLGVPVDVVDMAGAVDYVDRAVRAGARATCVLAVNPEKVITLSHDAWLHHFFDDAGLLIPDGIGVVWAARLLEHLPAARVPGADLMVELCALAARSGYPVFLFGACEEVSAGAAAVLQRRFPALRIAGRANGYVPAEHDADVVEAINRSGASILFVALGSPRQERWIAEHGPCLRVNVIQGIGGTLDTLVGRVRRAPPGWQHLNLEWLYRLLHDPRRMRRQAVLPLFVLKVLLSRLAAASARRPAAEPDGGAAPLRFAGSGPGSGIGFVAGRAGAPGKTADLRRGNSA
jgi:N-acetylglucosaminyldiphosphoundecaprenol N-acetyl-beta-D-mannosaminyltransferase